METKRTAMACWFLIVGVVMTTTFLVAANPVVNPSPPPTGKAPKTMMTVESNPAITDLRLTKPDLPLVPSRPSSAAARAPPSGQKSAAPPGEKGKQRSPSPSAPAVAGLSRVGVRRLGKGGTEGDVRGGGKGGDGREGGIPGAGSDDVGQLQQLKGLPSDDASLRYLMAGPVDTDGLQNGGQQQPYLGRGGSEGLQGPSSGSWAVDRLSSFALNDVPPLAMAEYLMLTGDFNGFDDALADIVAIGMMAPEEAEVYRETVRLEYDSLLRQEAAADNEYQEADDVLHGGVQPFLPPLAIEYPDYSYYDNGRGGSFNPSKYYGPSRQGDKLEEVLQQMLDSIASSYTVPGSEDNGSYKSPSGVKTSSSSSSSSSPSSALEDQLKSLDLADDKQTKGKTGGPKGGAVKGGGAGKGKGTGGRGGGKGSGGGGKSRKQDAKLPDAEKELKSVASQMPQNKTKEANSTKSRRPLSKEQASPP